MTSNRPKLGRSGWPSVANARELEKKARVFADQMKDLINRTVCDYAHVGMNIDSETGAAVVGTEITRSSVRSKPVGLRSGSMIPLWLDVSVRLRLDGREEKFLAVESSFFGISVGPVDQREDVLHYDFDRGKDVVENPDERYTEAHLQVHGRHEMFEAHGEDVGAKNRLGRYHLPVGGRRLRPCLEDLIEFLVLEKLVEPHDGWEKVVNDNRRSYRVTQIKALVRSNLGTAIDELRRIGYKIGEPNDPKFKQWVRYLLGDGPNPWESKKGKGK